MGFFMNSSAADSGMYAVQVIGASAGFRLIGSTFNIPQGIGALFVAAPSAQILDNTFTLDPNGSSEYPVLLGYTGNGHQNASGSEFVGNTVNGSDVTDLASSDVVIENNRVTNDGAHMYGIHAMVTIGTAPGLWVSGLTIAHNVVSDTSVYGIRVEQNVTHFRISDNLILDPSPHPRIPYGSLEEIIGIYAIRGVNNGSIDHNSLDLTDSPSIITEGIVLEADVNDVTVADNEIRNVSENAIDVQGDVPGLDSAASYQTGPSLRNVVDGNWIENDVPVQQTKLLVVAILLFYWANYTVVENNTIVGWNLTNTASYYNGVAFLTSSSYGTFAHNVVLGARYGFLFTDFGNHPPLPPGTFNRSDNLVYGNELLGISEVPVLELTGDGMGPVSNVIDLLDNTPTVSGAPSGFFQTVRSVAQISAFEWGGYYAVSLETWDPVTENVTNLTTLLPWNLPSFNVTVSGDLGVGGGNLRVDAVTSTSVNYTLHAATPLNHSVAFEVPAPQYTANYSALTFVGSREVARESVNSTSGPATFGTTTSGDLSVHVTLLGWNETVPVNRTPPPPSPNATLELVAATPADSPIANLSVDFNVSSPGLPVVEEQEVTNSTGVQLIPNLRQNLTVSAVRVESPGFALVSYAQTWPHADLSILSLNVLPPIPANNSTGPPPPPSTNGTAPPPPSVGSGGSSPSGPNGTGSARALPPWLGGAVWVPDPLVLGILAAAAAALAVTNARILDTFLRKPPTRRGRDRTSESQVLENDPPGQGGS